MRLQFGTTRRTCWRHQTWRTATQIEIPDELAAQVAEIAEKTGQDVQSLVAEMVTEAIKLRQVPTVHFEDGATGRRACVPGTGIPIWEIIESYEGVGRDREELGRIYDWLDSYQLGAAVEETARASGQDTSSLVAELATEAMKMRLVPGIVFADGASGRRARVEGTGIEVFEILQAYLAADQDRAGLGEAFHWLDQRHIDAALDYYRLFPDDVDPFLFHSDDEFEAFFEETWRKHPHLKPAST